MRVRLWGVAGTAHPATPEPVTASLEEVSHDHPATRWTVAHRQALTLHDRTPVDLQALRALPA
ncbi:hypothetical protein ACLIYM_14640 [Streptomyces fenghuangensis]